MSVLKQQLFTLGIYKYFNHFRLLSHESVHLKQEIKLSNQIHAIPTTPQVP